MPDVRSIASSNQRSMLWCFFFQAEDGIRDHCVTGVQTCALPIWRHVDLRTPALDAAHDRAGDLVRRARPDPRRQLHAAVREEAGVADETGEDHGHPDPARLNVLAQAGGEAAQAELGRRVDAGARRGDLARERRDEHDMPAPRWSMPGRSARVSWIGARRFRSMARSIWSWSKSSTRPLAGSAALATSTSTAPAASASRTG